jgi:hypothetical protein
MRKIIIAAGCAIALPALPAVAAQNCVKPVAPAVADKNQLSLEQRNAMAQRIDAYVAAMNGYLACLEQSDDAARAEAEAIIRTFEAPIEDLEIVQ